MTSGGGDAQKLESLYTIDRISKMVRLLSKTVRQFLKTSDCHVIQVYIYFLGIHSKELKEGLKKYCASMFISVLCTAAKRRGNPTVDQWMSEYARNAVCACSGVL